jgi:UDP-N-acetylmuramyl pentapeptide synthase
MFSGDIAGGGFLTATPPKVDVGAGESRDVSLSAFVDANVKAGKYTGTITVSSTKSTAKQTFEFTLTVKGEELPAWQQFLGDPLVLLFLLVIVIALLVGLMATARSRRRRASVKKSAKG